MSAMNTDLDYEVGGLSYRRRADGIHEFRFQVVTTMSVDAWFETASAIESYAHVKNDHIRSLYHIQGLWPTPYATKRIIEMARKTSSGQRLSTAILMDDHAIGIVVVQAILRQIPPSPSRLNMSQIFFQEDEALHWLEERRKALG
jgi:hypothetical protein